LLYNRFMQNLPQHIVIIPDGNRRWAKKRGKPPFFGHMEGAKRIGEILETALELQIKNLTFWTCSVDNLTKRSSKEVQFLIKIFGQYFKKLSERKEIDENKIKINVLGRWEEFFPEKLKKELKKIIKKTENYNDYNLTFLMAYSGTDEMTNAIQKIAKIKNQNTKIKIDEKLIKANLWTKDLPPVDLIIRTGSVDDPHWSSGMMMWDVADSQLYFTKTLFPDFSPVEFKKAIEQYNQTERRKGA